MTDELTNRILDGLINSELPDETQNLVLAALDGEYSLGKELDGSADRAGPKLPDAEPSPIVNPQRAYLKSISVRGFRGIGPEARLQLEPGPGLTMVVGRNGSGKSSFVEALEFLLTDTSLRWQNRKTKEWESGWKNLHADQAPRIAADFAVDGHEKLIRMDAKWTDAAELNQAELSTRSLQQGSSPPDLGWDGAAVTYRPLLSYPELASLAESGPSALHDAMAAVLGMEELVMASKVLGDAHKSMRIQITELKAAKVAVLQELTSSEDERAPAIKELLNARTPNLALLSAAVDGSVGDSTGVSNIDSLEQLAIMRIASAEDIADALSARQAAHQTIADLDGSAAARSAQQLALLQQAFDVHVQHGDQPCPVCGSGQLDSVWRRRVAAEIERLQTESAEVSSAQLALKAADNLYAGLLQTLPTIPPGDGADFGLHLELDNVAELVSLIRNRERTALHANADGGAEALGLWRDLSAAVDLVVESATKKLAELDTGWRPLVENVRHWLSDARRLEPAKKQSKDLDTARKWLERLITTVRDERFDPVADHAVRIWKLLRRNSNVSLEAPRLAGSNTRRRVEVSVTVDGQTATPLAVMSQGELNALALSLFLPRATLAQSPFGFIVIDDPVQAMDSSRVDGLALVLAEVATTRQVVVFTHDDRLPEAVRRLSIPGRTIDVRRGDRSRVRAHVVDDPVGRYLEDARAVARTPDVDSELVERVVGGLCRQAVEAAAIDAYRRRQLGLGVAHPDVEKSIASTPKFKHRCALGLWDDAERAGDVVAHFNKSSRDRGDAVVECDRGAHGGPSRLSPRKLAAEAKQLCVAFGWREADDRG